MASIKIIVDGGPLWLQYVTAFGTAGAAIFAAWAAWAATAATRTNKGLVELERGRDARAADEALHRHARRVLVELSFTPVVQTNGVSGHNMRLLITNASSDPVFKARAKVTLGRAIWGPVLLGNMPPGHEVTVTARLRDVGEETANTNGFVRFADVEGHSWVATARGDVRMDSDGLDQWLAEGELFASRSLTFEEKGEIAGVRTDPYLGFWRGDVPE